ncbi:biotin synthase auxiliary protein BsaP [Corynebacterium coyleae]
MRTCPLCGRRLGVKISPLSWEAACSRHGLLRSEWVER